MKNFVCFLNTGTSNYLFSSNLQRFSNGLFFNDHTCNDVHQNLWNMVSMIRKFYFVISEILKKVNIQNWFETLIETLIFSSFIFSPFFMKIFFLFYENFSRQWFFFSSNMLRLIVSSRRNSERWIYQNPFVNWHIHAGILTRISSPFPGKIPVKMCQYYHRKLSAVSIDI